MYKQVIIRSKSDISDNNNDKTIAATFNPETGLYSIGIMNMGRGHKIKMAPEDLLNAMSVILQMSIPEKAKR